jgi:cytochrome c peroxidase
VINAAYMPVMFWDGRAASLEEQALGPIENPIEMGHKMGVMLADLKTVPEYQKRFEAVFGPDSINKENVGKAIAAFERTVLSGNSPYDRFKAGDASALTAEQKRGHDLFMGKAACNDCHEAPVFSNGKYYNAGVGSGKPDADPGRKKVTNADADLGKFRVPHLRNAAETGPWFHDGSATKLEDAVKLMATGGIDNPNLSSGLKGLKDIKLADQDIADLVAFVKALSGEFPVVAAPKLP